MARSHRTDGLTALRAAAAGLCGFLAAAGGFAQQQAVPNAALLETEADDTRRYAVEIIVFEYAGSAANTTENFEPASPAVEPGPADGLAVDAAGWPRSGDEDTAPVFEDGRTGLAVAVEVPEPDTDDAFALSPGESLEEIRTYERMGIELIPAAEYQLGAAYRKLVELDAYRPLLHAAWTQPAVAEEDTEPLKLRRVGNPPLRLDGTVSLYLGRYLHLVVDLALEERVPQRLPPDRERIRYYGDDRPARGFGFEPADIAPVIYYRIQEDRILRSNETRYFDHPKFGVIARVTRVEEALPESADTTGDLLPGIN